ncbi:MAG TPA: DMT family transporter, partial [Acidisoma sp.]|nr:DMT family transporter [Acidisoma sp.]
MRLSDVRARLRPGPGVAIALVVLSSLLYSLGYAFSKKLIETWHFDARQLFLLRSVLVLIGLALMRITGWRGPSLARLLSPPHPWTQRIAATSLVVSAVFAMVGYGYLPVTTATAFSYTSPLLLTALAAIMLRERIPPQRWIAVIIGFVGVIVIVHPGDMRSGGMGHLIGVGAAFASATLYAIYQMLVRRAREAATTSDALAQAAVLGVILLVGFMPFVWKPIPLSALVLVVLATLTQTGGLITIATAIRMGQVSQLAPWQYGGMVWAMLLDLFMFGHAPGVLALTGAAMIVVGGLIAQLRLPGFLRP